MEVNKELVFASTSQKGEKVRSYTVVFKREAVSYAEQHSNHAAAKKYNVDRNSIRLYGRGIKKNLLIFKAVQPMVEKESV